MAKRDKDMQVNLEPIIYETVSGLSKRLNTSQSNYIRKLIIDDLRARGLVTDAMLAELAVAC